MGETCTLSGSSLGAIAGLWWACGVVLLCRCSEMPTTRLVPVHADGPRATGIGWSAPLRCDASHRSFHFNSSAVYAVRSNPATRRRCVDVTRHIRAAFGSVSCVGPCATLSTLELSRSVRPSTAASDDANAVPSGLRILPPPSLRGVVHRRVCMVESSVKNAVPDIQTEVRGDIPMYTTGE